MIAPSQLQSYIQASLALSLKWLVELTRMVLVDHDSSQLNSS